MSITNKAAPPAVAPPVEGGTYSLSEEEAAFFKSQIGIKDDEELKQHIIAVQKKAYEIYPYPCIRFFSFTQLRISRHPIYESVLKLHGERKDAVFLDLGCCFGNDARKAVVDGWPVQNVIASDLRQGLWDFGHVLFRSTPETFPAGFVAGDAFDDAMITPHAPFTDPPASPHPDLRALTSLTPLHGRVSVVHASLFFHLFTEEQQTDLARRLAGLLDPRPGSVIFGTHAGLAKQGPFTSDFFPPIFCHSPESWCALWDGEIFPKGTVHAEASLEAWHEISHVYGDECRDMVWSVTKL